MSEFIISIMHRDRTGIIADATGIISELNGNLEDISQTVLRGYFSMILMAGFPDDVTIEALDAALKCHPGLKDFTIGVKPYVKGDAPENITRPENIYLLTAAGPDRPCLVSTTARILKENDVNIVDLTTCISPSGEYTMIMEIALPENQNVKALKDMLKNELSGLGLDIEIRNHKLFRKTNEI